MEERRRGTAKKEKSKKVRARMKGIKRKEGRKENKEKSRKEKRYLNNIW